MPKELTTLEDLEKALSENQKVVIDFFATWCGPCKKMSPIFDKKEEEYSDIKFFKVNVDEAEDIVSKYEISAMPTFLFIKDKELIGKKLEGASEEKLVEFLNLLKAK